tara:strand:+ start:7539 stop:7910 length:372 start_codon:yes stop_codon:yes gene_type:complete
VGRIRDEESTTKENDMAGVSLGAIEKAQELLRAMQANEAVLAAKRAEEEAKAQAHLDLIARIARENADQEAENRRRDAAVEMRVLELEQQFKIAREAFLKLPPEVQAKKRRNAGYACGIGLPW